MGREGHVRVRPAAAWVAAGLVLAACLPSLTLRAARPTLRRYGTEDGLPQSQVTALAQDARGVLWIGTLAGGIARFDGQRFTTHDVSSGLPANAIYSLSADPESGVVWAATSGGLARARSDRFEEVPLPLERSAAAVFEVLVGKNGRVWLATRGGLLRREGEKAPFVLVPAEPGLRGQPVRSLARDGRGGILAGTDAGLALVADPETPLLRPLGGLPPGRIPALLARPGKPLLVAVRDVGLFEGADGAFARVGDDAAPGRAITHLLAESEENDTVWIATLDKGTFRLHEGRYERLSTAEGLPAVDVHTQLEDREGLLWLGTGAGLVKKGPSAFATLGEEEGFPPSSAAVFGMAQTRDGSLWFVLGSGGLLRSGPSGARLFGAADGLGSEETSSISADRTDGSLWIAASGRLLLARADRLRPLQGLPPRVDLVHALSDGSVAVSVAGRGIWKVGPPPSEAAPPRVGPWIGDLPGIVNCLAADPTSGTLWVGGDGWGVLGVGTDGTRLRLTVRDGLPSEHVNHLFLDRGGSLWVSTERGAVRRDPSGATRLFDRRSGLPDSYVYWVGQEPDGSIWMGTNRGAVRLPAGGRPEVYGRKDGLGSDECNDQGFLVDTSGRVLVASLGVAAFKGRPRARRAAAPVVYLEDPLVDDAAFPGLEGAELPHDCGPITFRFAAPSFTDEAAVRYRYRLLGLSSTWTLTPDARGEIRFGLRPGRYTFEVTARTGDDRPSEGSARVTFTIQPVWWQTPAAAGIAVLLLSAALALTVAYREGRLVARQQELERRVAERTEELRDANERLELLAVTDALTGLPNRRRLTERLHEALAFAQRRRTPLSVLLADIDHFKRVNDTLGHGRGDRLLVEVAQVVAAGRRTEDAAGRWGGEEFLVLLTGTDEGGARAVAERIREGVEELGLAQKAREGLPLSPTISLGVAIHEHDLSAEELVHRADLALYRAKRNGRNRVEVWSPATAATEEPTPRPPGGAGGAPSTAAEGDAPIKHPA